MHFFYSYDIMLNHLRVAQKFDNIENELAMWSVCTITYQNEGTSRDMWIKHGRLFCILAAGMKKQTE